MRRRIFISGICTFLFLFSTKVLAQAPSPVGAGARITLSEIVGCQPVGSTEKDWVEIYNSSSAPVDLSGWKIEKNASNGDVALSGSISKEGYLKISIPSNLSDNGFAVKLIDNTGFVWETFPSEYSSDASKTHKCTAVDDTVSWIKQGQSWIQTSSITGGQENKLIALPTPTPSPTPTPTPSPTASPTSTPSPTSSPTATPTPTPATQPTGIELSEIYACAATGEKEWIEIYNSTNSSVTLTGWKITDDDNNEQPISTQTIASKKYVAIEVTKYSRGMLTNDGDVVSLIDGAGKVVEKKEYELCTTGTSLAKVGSAWSETTSITKGTANSSQTPSPSPEVSESSEFSSDSDVLGLQTTEETAIVTTPLASASAKGSSASLLPAVAAIGSGTVIMGGVAGYFGYEAYTKKHGKPPFKLPFTKK